MRTSPLKLISRRALSVTVPLACALLAGCGSSADGPATASTHYPVTIENCGTPVTFERAPKRVATDEIDTAEDMFALGLQHAMVGTFSLASDGPLTEPVPRRYLAAYHSVREVSQEDATLEKLEALHAELLFAGWWNSGLVPSSVMTPQNLASRGIKTLALSESCGQVQPYLPEVSIDSTYRDLTNLGAIFGVPARAQAIVAQMKAQIAAVSAKVSKLPRVSVFLYENDPSDPVTALGLGTPTALIDLAGGRNVFASVKRTWTAVSWKQLAARKPRCIIIDNYANPTWQQKEAVLKSYPAMRGVPAIHDGCIMHLSYDELAPSPLNAQAVLAIARELHPRAFGLPAAPWETPEAQTSR